MGNDFYQPYICQRADLQNIQRTPETSQQNKNNPIKKGVTELNRELSIEEIKKAERHLRKCSTSLAIREMQIKTTLRYRFTSARMAKTRNTNDNLCWKG